MFKCYTFQVILKHYWHHLIQTMLTSSWGGWGIYPPTPAPIGWRLSPEMLTLQYISYQEEKRVDSDNQCARNCFQMQLAQGVAGTWSWHQWCLWHLPLTISRTLLDDLFPRVKQGWVCAFIIELSCINHLWCVRHCNRHFAGGDKGVIMKPALSFSTQQSSGRNIPPGETRIQGITYWVLLIQ